MQKTAARPASAATAPTTGPSIAPSTAAPIAAPISSPRRPRGRRQQPCKRAGPRERAACALCQPGGEQRLELPGEREADARQTHQRKAHEHRAPRCHAHSSQAAGEGADERADRICSHQCAGLALGEVQCMREVRQQRRQRCVEHRVREHQDRNEQKQTAHEPTTVAPGATPRSSRRGMARPARPQASCRMPARWRLG